MAKKNTTAEIKVHLLPWSRGAQLCAAVYWRLLNPTSHLGNNSFAVILVHHIMKWRFYLLLTIVLLQIASLLQRSEMWQRMKVERRCWIHDTTKDNSRPLFKETVSCIMKLKVNPIYCMRSCLQLLTARPFFVIQTKNLKRLFLVMTFEKTATACCGYIPLCIPTPTMGILFFWVCVVIKQTNELTLALNIFVFIKSSSFQMWKVTEEVYEGLFSSDTGPK